MSGSAPKQTDLPHQHGLPTREALNAYLATARTLATEAATVLRGTFGSSTAQRKADGSLVTEADQQVDRLLTHFILRAYPDHAVLSEEGNTIYSPVSDFTWIVDPLDGTTNFARGLPIWGVSIALLFRGNPVVGLLDFPMLDETFSAIRGDGAYLNDKPIQTSHVTLLDDQDFIVTCTRTPRRYRIETPLKLRIFGSAAYHIATVAVGDAVAGIEATPKVWDLAAALLILEESGGCYAGLADAFPLFPLPPIRQDYLTANYPLLAAANLMVLKQVRTSVFEIV